MAPAVLFLSMALRRNQTVERTPAELSRLEPGPKLL